MEEYGLKKVMVSPTASTPGGKEIAGEVVTIRRIDMAEPDNVLVMVKLYNWDCHWVRATELERW